MFGERIRGETGGQRLADAAALVGFRPEQQRKRRGTLLFQQG